MLLIYTIYRQPSLLIKYTSTHLTSPNHPKKKKKQYILVWALEYCLLLLLMYIHGYIDKKYGLKIIFFCGKESKRVFFCLFINAW